MIKDEIATLAKTQGLHLETLPGLQVLRLVQQQDLPLDVVLKGGSPQFIRGAVDALNWKTLQATAEFVKQVLVRTGTYLPEQLRQRSYLVSNAGKWNPAVEILTNVETLGNDQKERATSLVQVALNGLVGRNKHDQVDTFAMLDAESAETVRQCVDEARTVHGGKAFGAAIDVDVAGEHVAHVQGRVRSKPDRSNFSAVPVELQGKLTGFETEQEVLFLRSVEQGLITVNFGKLDLNFVDLAQVITRREYVRVRLHRTIDASGNPKYAYGCVLQGNEV